MNIIDIICTLRKCVWGMICIKSIDINDIETVVNEKWVLENVYKKIIDKL